MAFRSVLFWPNPELKKKSKEVVDFKCELVALANDL